MFGFFRRYRNLFRLATQDYRHEWQMSGCFVLALAAVLGPMMVLFGLKFGIIGSMVDKLVEDPSTREVRPIGSGRFDETWFKQWGERPDVGFLLPQTRSIAATMKMKSGSSPQIQAVELIPSGPGDPLLPDNLPVPTGLTQIILADAAAAKLQVKRGETVDGSLSRRFHGRNERVHLTLEVVAVAPASAFQRSGAFVSQSLMEAVEGYRDGRAVPSLKWTGDVRHDTSRTFPSFRMYANSIYDVSKLRDDLAAEGLEVRTQSKDIEVVQTMDRNLSAVFWVIAIIGLVGFSFSLGASLWANVDRKRRELSVLRLVGFGTGDIVWFPVLQAGYTAFLGWALASLLYLGVAYTINNMMAAQLEMGQAVCHLLPIHFLVAMGITLSSGILAAALAGFRSARVEPSEGLREI